jgi:hypothetical protein
MSRGSSRGSSHRSSSTTPPRGGSPSTTSPTPCIRASTRHAARHVARHAARHRLLCLAQARCLLLRLRLASWCLGTSRGSSRGSSRRSSSTTPTRAGSSSTTSPLPRVRVPRHVTRLITRIVAWLLVEYFASATRLGASARPAARHVVRRRSSSTTSPPPRVWVPRHVARLVVDYFAYATRPGASAHRMARCAACRRLLRIVQARCRLLLLCRASECLGTSRGLSRGSSRSSSSTTLPRAGSSSTTLPPPRIRVPRHVPRLVTRLVAPLVVDYSASCRLVVDYFTSAAHPGASARRAARHADCCVARRRVLFLHRASGCLGTSRGSSRGSSPLVVDYSASRRLVVDYFASAARLGASARRAARRPLLRLHRESGCLGTSRGSLHRLSSTTSPTPRVQVPRHVARLVVWLVAPLVIDYFAYAARPGASARRAARHTAHHRLLRAPRLRLAARVPRHVARLVTRLIIDYSVRRDFVLRPCWLYFNHVVRRDYLSRGNTGSTSSTPRATTTSSSGRIASTIHLD